MALKLVKRNKLLVHVTGSQTGEDGKAVPFDFKLQCVRLSQEELDAALADKKESVAAFMKRVTNGWELVLDDAGQPFPFSEENFAAVLSEAGMPAVCFQSYLKDVGAVAKN
jgi:hypothetical protein